MANRTPATTPDEATAKTDLKTTLDGYRATRGVFRLLDVPVSRYLMLDGHGDPNTSPAFVSAVETLYPVAYRLKATSRRELGHDYVVPPLEGLWWSGDMDAFTTARDKAQWEWTLMLLVPDWIEPALVDAALADAATRADPPPYLAELRVETLAEGRCAQTLHVGSYDDEATVLAELHRQYLPEHGLTPTGRHHEIYLSDARRVEPAKRRTILRQPVADA